MVKKVKEHAAPESGIEISAQQSRFHVVDAPASKEVLVKDLCVAVQGRELLSHAELQLKEGSHYVLIGRNGTGKSTLLRAIADGSIPQIPWTFDVLLLGQTTLDDDFAAMSVGQETVLQHVMRSDRLRERYQREAELLSTALEASDNPTKPVIAFRQISHERLRVKVERAEAKAARTSSSFRDGARGLRARKALIEAEKQLDVSRGRLEVEPSDITTDEMSSETQAAAEMLVDVQSALEMMEAAAAEANARTVLLGLGFSVEKIDTPMSELSGGWKTRCRIACALCQHPDILLLDEPTNFLDLPSIIWLQNYVVGLQKTTVVVVTHDRDFADAVAQELIILRNQQLEKFRGNLSTYERVRHEKHKHMTKMKDAQEKQKKHMESTIQSNVRAAKRTGDDKKLKQAASRQKKLDDRMGMQKSANGGRFKLNRDMAGFHLSSRGDIEVPDFDPPAKLVTPSTVADLRFPGALLHVEKMSFSYGGQKKGPEILTDVDLTIHPGERVGLCGLNGSGKSTLVSLIMAPGSRPGGGGGPKPTKGRITWHPRAKFARFTQDAIEALEALAALDPHLTALAYITRSSGAGAGLDEGDARALLAGLGLASQTAAGVPLAALSGGQKVRVALADVFVDPPHLLVLDEVTTHLDADTILALVLALRGYPGAVLAVTHDRFFMKCVVEGENPYRVAGRLGLDGDGEMQGESGDEEECARNGRVYRVFKGGLRLMADGMRQYEDIAAKASSKFAKVKT